MHQQHKSARASDSVPMQTTITANKQQSEVLESTTRTKDTWQLTASNSSRCVRPTALPKLHYQVVKEVDVAIFADLVSLDAPVLH